MTTLTLGPTSIQRILPIRPNLTRLISLITCGTLLISGLVEARGGQLYRWVDEQGNVNYTDRIPPGAIEREHTELTGDGIRLRTVPSAPTPEELQRERELARLREQQRRLGEQQQAEDNALLASFRSADDLVMARDGKIASVDVMLQVTRNNVRRQQDWLNGLNRQAMEDTVQPITEDLGSRIAKAEGALRRGLAAILRLQRERQEIRDRFAHDLERFQELKASYGQAIDIERAAQSVADANLIECRGEFACRQAWEAALGYLREHTTMSLETADTHVAMTKAPVTPDDISLMLARIEQPDRRGAVIFLDLQCQSYSASADACRTDSRLAVLNGFRSAVEADIGDVVR